MAISLRENRKKELKEEIFFRAVKLFSQKGFENVTVEDITTACGIAKGTFYNYFPKKEHILLHMGRSQLGALRESIGRHAAVEDVRERLRLIFKDVVAYIDGDTELLRAVVVEIMRSSQLERELQLDEEAELMLTPLFDEAIEKGQVSSRWSGRQLSALVVGMYHNMLLTWLKKVDNTDLTTIFEKYLDMLWFGIGSGRGEAGE